MTFLAEPTPSAGQQQMYDDDLAQDGWVWDLSRLWAHQPDLNDGLTSLIRAAGEAAGLSDREKAMLVLGQAATIGDSLCSVAWGRKLTQWSDGATVVATLQGDVDGTLTERERVLAGWARKVAADPNDTTPDDVQALRDVGFDEAQVLALTTYLALRIAFSVTNDALGAGPDQELLDAVDPAVRDAVTWGRRP